MKDFRTPNQIKLIEEAKALSLKNKATYDSLMAKFILNTISDDERVLLAKHYQL